MKLLSVYENNNFFARYGDHKHLFVGNLKEVEKGFEQKPDLLILWGGGDISPTLYGEPSTYSHADETLSYRDILEKTTFDIAVKEGIPVVGICRGLQMIAALNGKKLWQHVDNHVGHHNMTTKDTNQIIKVTSLHHQAVQYNGVDDDTMIVTGLSTECRSPDKFSLDRRPSRNLFDVEAAFFPKTKAFGVQGHPEYTTHTTPFTQYTVNAIKQYLGVEL